MHTIMRPGRLYFGATMIALGVTGLVNGDFALVWQHVPAHLPGRAPLAYLCALIELGVGCGLLVNRTAPLASRVLFPYMLLWMVLLVVPMVIAAPLDAGAWGSFGEIGAIAAGAWCLFATHSRAGETTRLRFATGPAGIRAARWLLIVALACLGQEVIVDAVHAGVHIMQPWLQWLPWPAGWAILTGIGSIATSLAMLFDVWPRLATTLQAAMVTLIGLLYWAPDLYTGRTATTAFIITLLVAAGIAAVADSYADRAWCSTPWRGKPTHPTAGIRTNAASPE